MRVAKYSGDVFAEGEQWVETSSHICEINKCFWDLYMFTQSP